MKFLLSTAFAVLLLGFNALHAQTETPVAVDKYALNFKKALTNLDSSWANPSKMRETAAQFERLANFKKDDWLPRYYHALCLIQVSFTADAKEREAILKAAETSIKAGQELSKDNLAD